MTDEERLALIDCAMYDPTLHNAVEPDDPPVTLGEWAVGVESWSEDQFNGIPGVREANGRLGGMTYAEFKRVAEAVTSDTTLSGYVIENVTARDVRPVPGVDMSTVIPGRDATFRDPSTGQFVVAFQGTAGPGEWLDNGKGGYAGVADTPDQTAALEYFNYVAGQFGWTSDTDVTVTGHSKGGNLAVYVAVLRPDMVDHAFSLDGQGFDDAFILKYQKAIQQLVAAGAIQTYANSMDFVNILFHAIGQVTYTTAPDATGGFQYHHSPFAVFEESGGALVFRPEAPQDPNMAMADNLVNYVERFMSADDFASLCQMAVGLAGNTLSLDQIVDTSKLSANAQAALDNIIASAGVWMVVGLAAAAPAAGLAVLLVAGIAGLVFGAVGAAELTDTWETVSSALKEPYKTMLDDFWVLLGNFVIENGVDDPEALKDLLDSLFPGFWQSVGVNLGTDKVLGDLRDVARLPYSAVVRDFSDAVRQELLQLADRVAPHDLGQISDFFSDWFLRPPELDFDADDDARRAYYQETMDKGDVSRAQIDRIFTDVAAADHLFSGNVLITKGEADAASDMLKDLLAKVQANVRAAGG